MDADRQTRTHSTEQQSSERAKAVKVKEELDDGSRRQVRDSESERVCVRERGEWKRLLQRQLMCRL